MVRATTVDAAFSCDRVCIILDNVRRTLSRIVDVDRYAVAVKKFQRDKIVNLVDSQRSG